MINDATSATTSMIRSRNSAFSTAGRPGLFRVALYRDDFALQLRTLPDRAVQIAVGLALCFEVAAQLIDFGSARGKKGILVLEPHLQGLHTTP